MMDKEIKQRWLEALRSGKYPQGRGYLLRDGRYCCLGVLCEVLGHEKLLDAEGVWREGDYVMFKDRTGRTTGSDLNPSTLEEVGMTLKEQAALMLLNDEEGKDFGFISDYIEENL